MGVIEREHRGAIAVASVVIVAVGAAVSLRPDSPSAYDITRITHDGPGGHVADDSLVELPDARRPRTSHAGEPSALAEGSFDPFARAEGTVDVRVVDESGVLPMDVTVAVARGAERTEFALPEEGPLSFPVAQVAGATLCALAPGHSVDTVQVSERPRSEYVLSITEEATITGALRMIDGEPAPEGARVFAWRLQDMSPVENGLDAYVSLPRGFVADVDDDGTFRIEGLRPGTLYGVTAFGGGVVVESGKEPRSIVAPHDGIEVVAGYLGGVEVDFDCPDSARALLRSSVRSLPDLPDPPNYVHDIPGRKLDLEMHPPFWGIEWSSSATGESERNWSVRLAGLGRPQDRRGMPPVRLFVSAPSRAATRVDGSFLCALPVVGALQTPIETEPVSGPDDIPRVLVPLEGLPTEWEQAHFGSVRVRFDVSPDAATDNGRMSSARVRLLPEGGSARDALTLRAALRPSDGSFEVTPVPEGRYSLWFYDEIAGTSVPYRWGEGKQIEVVAGQTAEVDLTDVPVGTIELNVLRPDGRLFTGSVDVSLLVPNDDGTYLCLAQGASFGGPPYRLSPIPIDRLIDGKCSLHVSGLLLGRTYRMERPLIDVTAGDRTTLTFQMVDLRN